MKHEYFGHADVVAVVLLVFLTPGGVVVVTRRVEIKALKEHVKLKKQSTTTSVSSSYLRAA